MLSKITKSPVDEFYKERSNFTLIGVTGIAGSGCSYLSSIAESKSFLEKCKRDQICVSMSEEEMNNDYLFHNKLDGNNQQIVNRTTFHKKYSIVKSYSLENYQTYYVLKYTHVLWLYTLLFIRKRKKTKLGENELKENIHQLFKELYSPSKQDISLTKKYNDTIGEIERDFIFRFDLNELVYDLNDLYSKVKEEDNTKQIHDLFKDQKEALFNLFNGNAFRKFISNIHSYYSKRQYFLYCMFCHRLAINIRTSGNPFHKVDGNQFYKTRNVEFLFNVVELLNLVIKGYRKVNDGAGRIIIDAIRNSMEATYFRERYAAFYLISIHSDRWRQNIAERVRKELGEKNTELIDITTKCINKLAINEAKEDDFENGFFCCPDVSRCIAEAEIHMVNRVEADSKDNLQQALKENIFYSLEEQWMKYSSLILCPGLITPSSDERCMIIAYSAKFNSGCLSRQVGAAITNQFHSIRSIGWNDVPYGQIPCDLRSLADFHDRKNLDTPIYSEFEHSNGEKRYRNTSFREKVIEDYSEELLSTQKSKGYAVPYCFKTLENNYKQEKNQVFTRSLHAEENAMLQNVKYGGEGLLNGIIYVTASPCELCSKKLYQIGIRKIVYIDPYPGIARDLIIRCGYKRPMLVNFQGAFGTSYFKLYRPFMSYKDELAIRFNKQPELEESLSEDSKRELEAIGISTNTNSYSISDINRIIRVMSSKIQKDNK